jgi:hypothetical protein
LGDLDLRLGDLDFLIDRLGDLDLRLGDLDFLIDRLGDLDFFIDRLGDFLVRYITAASLNIFLVLTPFVPSALVTAYFCSFL